MNKKQQFAMAGACGGVQGAMAFRRGPAGNHVEPRTRDKWERQADEAARRIMRGERNIARLLTPASAASYSEHLSAGRPLPSQLREDLEAAFGADLGAVRIHSDAASSAAARNEHALAFTSGRDIYFAPGRFDASAPGGRRLLAHEIAHVLQQTARRNSGGSMQAMEVTGSGQVQRKDDEFVDLADSFGLFNSSVDWDGLKKAYAGIPDFATHADRIEKVLPAASSTSPAQIADLLRLTTAVDFKKLPDETKGLYVDAVKTFGSFPAAANLLIANPSVPTAFRSRPLYEQARKLSVDWTTKAAAQDSFAKDYYPARLIAVYETFFLSPGMEPLDLNPAAATSKAETFRVKVLAELNSLKAAKGLVANELRAAMLLAFYYLDEGLRDTLPKQRDALRGASKSLVEAHRDLAEEYGRRSAVDLAPSLLKESIALFSGAFKGIQDAAIKAAKFWNRILTFKEARQEKGGFGDLTKEEVKSLADGIKTDSRLKRLPALLLETGKSLFARPGGSLLNPGVFSARIGQRQAALKAEMASYVSRLVELVRAGKDNEPEGVRLGLAFVFLAEVEQVLARYDHSRDAALSKNKRADERVALRARLAQELLDIAVLFAWDDLREAANSVFREGLQLAILTDWEPDPEADFGTLTEEAGAELADREGTGISGALLDKFVYIQYFDILTAELTNLLQQRGSDFSYNTTPILSEAIYKAKTKAKRPRRFFVREWEVGSPSFARAKGGVTASSVDTFNKAVFTHPSTLDLLKRERKEDDLELAPAYLFRPGAHQLFVWIVPKFDEFIKLIAGQGVVRQAVEGFWKTQHKNEALPDPEKQPRVWLEVLGSLAASLRGGDDQTKEATLEALAAAIKGAVETEFQRARKAALAEARLAVSHERRVFVEQILRPPLADFDLDDNSQWAVPGKVFDNIRKFAAFVWPVQDQALQMSALVFEIAPELNKAFGAKSSSQWRLRYRFDIIDVVLTLAFESLRVWNAGQADASKVASGTASPVNPITAISWLSQGELEKRAQILGDLRDSFAKAAESAQRVDGLHADKNTKALSSVYWDREGFALIKWNMTHTSVKAQEGFSLYRNDYFVIDVLESFTFHPAFGRRETLGVNWPTSPGRPGDAFVLDGSGAAMKPTGRKLFSLLHKPKFGDSEIVEVTDQDTRLLTWFSSVLSEHFAYEYIGAAGVFLEKYANVIMDVLEFLPGVGQGLAAARFVATVLETISSPEFKDVLDAFSKDGFRAIPKALDALASLVQFEELANVLIFDANFQESVRNHPSLQGNQEKQRKAEGRGGAWVRIGKLLKHIVEIGKRVLARIERLAHKVQAPVRDAQLWILRHPAAVLILDLVERGFDILSSLTIADLAQETEDLLDKDWEQMIKKGVFDAAQETVDRGRNMLDTLRHLELPEEVVPVEWIIDFIIDLAVRALSAKYRKGVQAVRGILRTLGLWDKVLGEIKSGLFENGVNPNELYQQQVRDKLQPWLADVRDQFAGDLTATLQNVPFLSTLTKPKGTPITLDFSGLGFPESEGHGATPVAGHAGGFGLAGALPTDGPRLPQNERARSEAALGHDFGHVRLHQGAPADQVTQAFHADAITTGSHVFLRSGLTPGEPTGRRILNHELAHVIQQTGPRPIGAHLSDSPVVGRPHRGLYWDASREAAADRAADTVTSGHIARRPVAVGGKAHGIQPSFTAKFLRGFLRHLHKDADIVEAREDFEKARKKVVLDPESQAVAAALGPALKPWLEKRETFESPFGSVYDKLKTFVDAVWPEFEQGIPLLVGRAVNTMSPPKSAGEDLGPQAYLPAESLKVQLERELYGLTSMAFVIELNDKRGPKTIKERKIVDKDKPIKKARMVYAHLPLLKETSESEKLWDLLVENTFKGTADYTAATHDSFKAATKLVLGRGSPAPETYDRTQFKLSGYRAKVVRNQRGRMTQFIDKTQDWPSRDEYLETQAASVRAAVRQIGLRLGTYAVWRPTALTKDFDRDAHHTVQYLLFEYFRNKKTKKPFPLLGSESYPGVIPSGNEVREIVSPTKGTISVEDYERDHGAAVTTIFLSRHAHQSGIHYHTEPPDDGSNLRPTQGGTVDNTFRSFLDDYESVMRDRPILTQLAQNQKDGKSDEPIASSTSPKTVNQVGKPITVNRVSNVIFDATQKTYKDMWSEMKPKLKRALSVQEVAYYNAIAKLREMPTLKGEDTTPVFHAVANETEAEIGTRAGFGPGFKP